MNETGSVHYHMHLPAVHHNGVVPCPPLDLPHLINDISDGLHIGTLSILSPVEDVELGHLVSWSFGLGDETIVRVIS